MTLATIVKMPSNPLSLGGVSNGESGPHGV